MTANGKRDLETVLFRGRPVSVNSMDGNWRPGERTVTVLDAAVARIQADGLKIQALSEAVERRDQGLAELRDWIGALVADLRNAYDNGYDGGTTAALIGRSDAFCARCGNERRGDPDRVGWCDPCLRKRKPLGQVQSAAYRIERDNA